jgi:hypothetical protein
MALDQVGRGMKSKLEEIVPEYEPLDLNSCEPRGDL